MFIKKLDWLSPPITLYFKGENQHASIVSAIISIICYISVLALGVYYALGYIRKENPKAYFFNRYVVDAGYFPVNSSSMFNFIQICDQMTNEVVPFDFSVFRIVGMDNAFYDEYMTNPNILNNISHWVYGYCNNNSDTVGIGHLINFKYFEQSACIRQFYDKDKNKYFNTGDPEFKWPVIEKGCSNPDRTYYGIIMQRCDYSPNILKSQGPECKAESEITEFINRVSLKFQLIDQYIDMLNYKKPFTKYFYEVTSAITNEIFIINHLNFNPANMLTHNGIFIDNKKEERSYSFTQNEKHTIEQSQGQSTNGCLIGIYFWMQNTLQYYERNYELFQDLLSDIGGVSSIVVTISYYLNLLVHNYVIVLDTQDLVLNRDHDNYSDKRELKRKPTIFRKANEFNDNNIFFEKKQNEPINNNEIKREKEEKENNKKLNEEMDKNDINIYVDKKRILRNRNNSRTIISNHSSKHNSVSFSGAELILNNNKNRKVLSFKEESENSEEDYENRPLERHEFNWFKYIWFLISCRTNDKKIAYYEEFRAKLISEENIIQSYVDIYKLLNNNNLKRINI